MQVEKKRTVSIYTEEKAVECFSNNTGFLC